MALLGGGGGSGGGGSPYTLAIGNPIVGSTDGMFLYVGPGGVLAETTSSAVPGGPDQSIQFNNAGVFDGDANFTWNNTNNILSLNNIYVFTPQAGSICMGMALACGNLSMSGENNICIGGESGSGFGGNGISLTTGDENVFISSGVGRLITTGSRNTFVGSSVAKSSGVDISDNVGIGRGVMNFLGTGSSGNVCVGQGSMTNASCNYAVAIGYQNLGANTATGVVAIGFGALSANTSGYNLAIGDSALYQVEDGSGNIGIGSLAGAQLDVSQNNNTFVGYQSGSLGTLYENCTFVGSGSGANNNGTNNVAIGAFALNSQGSGTSIENSGNTAIGAESMSNVIDSVVGSNVAVGYSSAISLTSGFRSVFIGAGADTSKGDVAASIALGTGAIVTADNQFVVGGASAAITTAYFGNGVSSASPSSITFYATNGLGTDKYGADFIITGGVSTGTALGGSVFIVTSPSAGGSSATPNFEVTNVQFSPINSSSVFNGRIQGKQGSNVSSANDIVLGDGNQFFITGTATVNTISSINWQAGSRITLIATSTCTLAHNTAGSGARLFLDGSANLVCAANTVVELEFDGTQWQQVAPAKVA